MLIDFPHFLSVNVVSSRFCLNVGWLYTRLVAFNSFDDDVGHLHVDDEAETPTPPNESTSLLAMTSNPALNAGITEFMAMYALIRLMFQYELSN